MLAQLKHPNIIGYYNFFRTEECLNIVLEYAAGGDLAMQIRSAQENNRPFSEEVILFWFSQIASALEFTHAHKILHRDLKTQNIFLTKDKIIKLGDFGIARVWGAVRGGLGFFSDVLAWRWRNGVDTRHSLPPDRQCVHALPS